MTPTETQETADLSADDAVRTCARCKIEKPLSASVIHGHHHDYSRPLDVEWLCGSCHAIRHRKY
jgi:ribosomal protein S27AE